MHDIELEPATPGATPPQRRRRWLLWTLAVLLALVAVGAVLWWQATRPPAPVSVASVIDRFRSATPGATGQLGNGPATGVYVYATTGSEHITFSNLTHKYPAQTTLTVTRSDCGLNLRWEALAGRSAQWNVCRDADGWRLDHYVDVHKFLYMKDVHEYDCTGFPTVVCRTDTGVLTSTVERVGAEQQTVAGQAVQTSHLRIAQNATGKSTSEGTIDVWVLPSGLPARVEISDHGSQVVLGSHIDYSEAATLQLTSQTPRR